MSVFTCWRRDFHPVLLYVRHIFWWLKHRRWSEEGEGFSQSVNCAVLTASIKCGSMRPQLTPSVEAARSAQVLPSMTAAESLPCKWVIFSQGTANMNKLTCKQFIYSLGGYFKLNFGFYILSHHQSSQQLIRAKIWTQKSISAQVLPSAAVSGLTMRPVRVLVGQTQATTKLHYH